MLIQERGENVETLRAVLESFAALERRHQRHSRIKAKPRSVSAVDGQSTHPVQIDHYISYCLLLAVDLGRSIRTLIAPDGKTIELPIAALYPLARSLIEASSAAIWVTAPDLRRDRIIRRLQVGHDELRFENDLVRAGVSGYGATDAARFTREQAQSHQHHLGLLRRVAARNVINDAEWLNAFPGWQDVVRAAGGAADISNDGLVVWWRLCSGFTHPSMRRGVSMLSRQEQSAELDPNGDVLSVVLTTRTDVLLGVLQAALIVCDIALGRWAEAKIQVDAERTRE